MSSASLFTTALSYSAPHGVASSSLVFVFIFFICSFLCFKCSSYGQVTLLCSSEHFFRFSSFLAMSVIVVRLYFLQHILFLWALARIWIWMGAISSCELHWPEHTILASIFLKQWVDSAARPSFCLVIFSSHNPLGSLFSVFVQDLLIFCPYMAVAIQITMRLMSNPEHKDHF